MTSPENAAGQPSGRIKVFAHLTAEKAALYRAIMRVFRQSQERFVLHLRQEEILDEVRNLGHVLDQEDVDSALEQLCEWGNLQTYADTTDVRTVEDFYKQRYLYQITGQGEAAERALELFQTASERTGELQSSAVADIQGLLQNLKQLSKAEKPDSSKIHRDLLVLQVRFQDLTSCAHAFMSGLQRKIDLQIIKTGQHTSSTQRLIDYVERFVGELMIAADDIAQTFRDIGPSGSEKLLRAAAQRSIANSVETTPQSLDDALDQWRTHWKHFQDWFISRPGRPSNAESLRTHARASIPALLSVLTSINDQRINRIDRSNDLRVLARWFAEAGSDADAHRLWRVVFGLCPARHLIVNDATLDQHESQDVSADTSWLDAPPLSISPRLRVHGSYPRNSRLSRIIDRTSEKEQLAAATQEEALRILSAQSRFATGRRMRLSELEQFATGEFDIFLDLLGEAVSAAVLPGDTAEILSSDGCLRVKLEPTGDGRTAVIHTPEGFFSGPDHWISVERISSDEVIT